MRKQAAGGRAGSSTHPSRPACCPSRPPQERLQTQLEEAQGKEAGLVERAQSAERQLIETVRREAELSEQLAALEVRSSPLCCLSVMRCVVFGYAGQRVGQHSGPQLLEVG